MAELRRKLRQIPNDTHQRVPASGRGGVTENLTAMSHMYDESCHKDPPELPLFRVGLLCRMGIGKSRDGHAIIIDADDPRIRVEWDAEGLGRRYLRDQADIGDGRPIAVAEDPARRMFGEQRLN